MKKVAVVILNWNGRKHLETFLPSVIAHSQNVARIIVADNASTDDSLSFLEVHYPEIEVLKNTKNEGFAGGYNWALKRVEAEIFVLLNSDIEVSPGWIEPIIALMESSEKIAICQPKLLSYTEPKHFEYAGAAGGFIDFLGYPFCRGRMFSTLEEDQGQYDQPQEIFWASGAALFVKSSVYKEMGGLDDDFFAHMEEIDFCWRARSRGYQVYFCPESTVYHLGGGTLPKKSPYKTYLNFRNNLILLYKNLPSRHLFPVFFIRFFLDFVAATKFLFGGSMGECFAVMRGYLHFLKSYPQSRKKRSSLHQRPLSLIYRRSLVFDYYILKKGKFSELKEEDFS